MTVSCRTWSSVGVAGRPRCSPRWRRPVPDPLAELLANATERTGLDEVPGKSGASLERVVIDGQDYVLKHLDRSGDWTMRASGCLPGAPLILWERGILARLPGCLNQPIVAAAPGPARVLPPPHGRPARGILGLRPRVRRRPRHAPLPGAVALDGRSRGRRRLPAPGP